jgi:hypothetical protein
LATVQYLRKCNLVVAGEDGKGLDLSGLRITFKVKKTDAETPNTAEMRVYNLSKETVQKFKKEYTRIILQAGYESNYGVLFDGNIKQVKLGREGNTDNYIDIAAGDGDNAYNYATVNTTLASGAKQEDQVNAATKSMETQGAGKGSIDNLGDGKLPRGKVMYGMARDYIRQSAAASGTSWSIQDGKVTMIKTRGLLPGQAVLLNSKTGLVGVPEQTNDGIEAKCLLNPLLKIGSAVKINERDIQQVILPDTSKDDAANSPAALSVDGIYKVYTLEHTGDTRGNDWYSVLKLLDVDASAPAGEEVQAQ